MSERTQRRLPQDKRYKTANDAWKAQWNNHLAWSTMFAVAAHVSTFVFWPAWENSDAWLDSDLELLGSAWITLYTPPPSGGGGGSLATATLALVEEPDSLPAEEVDGGALVGGSEASLASLAGGLRERLTGRGGPVPTIVQFGPAYGPAFGPAFGPASGPPGLSNDRADTRVQAEVAETGDDPPAADLTLLLEASPMDLSRLSGVRPEMVLPGTSAWILIRNPSEVDRFMVAQVMNTIANGENSQVEGLVDVAVWIDEWGSVEWAEISRSSGREEMDEIALALFTEVASFRPARDRGIRVSLSAIFSVPFPW